MGMNIGVPRQTTIDTRRQVSDRDFVTEFQKPEFKGAQIFLVIMNEFGITECYSRIKRAAELQCGVLTQCIKDKTVFRMSDMTAGNVLLKINAKLGGLNHELAPRIK